jgi:ABC-type multidrug transport system fused ATPase/permease subunit
MTIDAAEAHNDYLAEEIRVFRLLSSNIHLFWSPALKLWLTFTVLYLFLQNEMLPILITVVALLLLNFIRCDLDVTSKHLKLLNEVISNIRSVKLRGWEKSLQELLNNHRLTETNSRIFSKFVNFGIDIYPQVVPYLLVLIIVGVNIPSPNLFIALYLIYQLGDTISEIRFFVQIVRQLPAANTRLKQFLLADQIEKKEGPALIENAMIMENAYFSIDNQISMPIFVDVNLNIQKGELIAVVGEDMRRCKLFLRALSGELKRLDGNVKLNGSIGYISSNPWIMNTCIRDNIELFAPKGNQAFGKVVRQFGLDDVLIDEARKKTKGYDLVG